MPARIYFRGVCLYVVEGAKGSEYLYVMMPKADVGEDRSGGKGTHRDKAKHYPLLSIFDAGASTPSGSIIDLKGLDLGIMGEAPLRQVNRAGMLSMRDGVGSAYGPVTPFKVSNGRATTTVKVGSGRLSADRDSTVPWLLRASHGIGFDQHGVRSLGMVWEAPTGDPVQIVGGGGALATVNDDQVAVIGHYDDPDDAKLRDILDVPNPGVNFDADFEWIYDLITPRAYPRYVPELVRQPKTGTLSPMTSTCFGGVWP